MLTNVLYLDLDGFSFRQSNTVSAFSACVPLDSTTSLCFSPLALFIPIAVAVAVAVSVAVSVGVAKKHKIKAEVPHIDIGHIFLADLPANLLSFPATGGPDLSDDHCGDSSSRFGDGYCYPIMKRGPCSPTAWVTVDPTEATVKAGLI